MVIRPADGFRAAEHDFSAETRFRRGTERDVLRFDQPA
jgi:hypothetical protein